MASPPPPLVSVCMIAYNHERYIGQAVQSVLEQETPFPVELVIGDDSSTDGTRALLRSWKERHPDRIRLLLPDRNQGMMANFSATLAACRSPYVAICEGDDYWIDRRKLDKQVAHLEGHPSASACFHNAWIEDEQGERTAFHTGLEGRSFEGRDLFERWLVPTASIVFRNPGLGTMPPFFARATHGDLALFLLLAERGSFRYLDETMSVYRRHAGGVMTSFRGIAFNRREIAFLEEMDAHFAGKYHDLIGRRVAGLHRSTAVHMLAAGGRRDAARELAASWRASARPGRREVRESVRILAGLALPHDVYAGLLERWSGRR